VYIDYQKLNQFIEKDEHSLSLIKDLLDKLKDARVFSTLDPRNGFFHVVIEEQNQKYTAFVTGSQYQFLKISFGLCSP